MMSEILGITLTMHLDGHAGHDGRKGCCSYFAGDVSDYVQDACRDSMCHKLLSDSLTGLLFWPDPQRWKR